MDTNDSKLIRYSFVKIGNLKIYASILIMPLFFFHTALGADYQLRGKVHVMKATDRSNIYVYYRTEKKGPCKSCISENQATALVDERGFFNFAIKNVEPGEVLFLQVVSANLFEYFSPFFPTKIKIWNLPSRYQETEIPFGKRKTIDVGVLKNIINYKKVSISLRDLPIEKYPSENEWWIKVTSDNQDVEHIASLPKNSLLPRSKSIVFLLPIDTWTIELSKSYHSWESIGKAHLDLTGAEPEISFNLSSKW